jgi:hypothetical protein
MSAYDAQEVTGFVYVDASSDLRCSFTVMVVKNGAGTWEVASVDLAGDNLSGAPFVTFSMSGSILRVTLANIPAVFASAYIRYQLSAPYLGGNYPLSVSASQVLGNSAGVAPSVGYIGYQVRSAVAAASAITLTTNVNTDVTSIVLTPGVWDISLVCSFTGTVTGTQCQTFIGTASGNFTTGLVPGDNEVQSPTMPNSVTNVNYSVPSYRVTVVSGTTTYYLKAFGLFSSGTLKSFGRISATLIG